MTIQGTPACSISHNTKRVNDIIMLQLLMDRYLYLLHFGSVPVQIPRELHILVLSPISTYSGETHEYVATEPWPRPVLETTPFAMLGSSLQSTATAVIVIECMCVVFTR